MEMRTAVGVVDALSVYTSRSFGHTCDLIISTMCSCQTGHKGGTRTSFIADARHGVQYEVYSSEE